MKNWCYENLLTKRSLTIFPWNNLAAMRKFPHISNAQPIHPAIQKMNLPTFAISIFLVKWVFSCSTDTCSCPFRLDHLHDVEKRVLPTTQAHPSVRGTRGAWKVRILFSFLKIIWMKFLRQAAVSLPRVRLQRKGSSFLWLRRSGNILVHEILQIRRSFLDSYHSRNLQLNRDQ